MTESRKFACRLLLLTGLVVSAAAVSAQSPWPTTQFEVVSSEMLLTPGVVPQGAAEDLIQNFNAVLSGVDEWLVARGMDPTLARVYFPDEETRREIETYLSEVAVILESWGFPPPVLQVRNGRYRVLLAATSSAALMGTEAAGVYHPPVCGVLGGYLSLSAQAILSGDSMTPRGQATAAHELFHAVQFNTSFLGGTCMPTTAGSWITEGTADAIGIDLARRLRGQAGGSSEEVWGKRDYARRLPVPFPLRLPFNVEWTEEDRLPYLTSSFWRFLGEYDASRLAGGQMPGPYAPGSAVDYAYLARMLARGSNGTDCVGSGAACDGELRWLNDGLRVVFGRSLQDLYPLFAGNVALYATHRVGLSLPAAIERWDDDVFEVCRAAPLNAPNREFRGIIERFEPVSMRCWDVAVESFEPDTLLQVEVKAPAGAFELADLRAAVTEPRIQTYATRLKVDPNDGWQSMTWTLPLGQDGLQRVLFTNVAGDPARSALMRNLPFTFRILREYAVMQIEGDADNNSDDNSSNYEVAPALISNLSDGSFGLSFDPPVARGTCLISLNLSSEQNDGLSVIGLINPPLRPGRYIIQRNGGGHQNLDVLGASLMWNSRSDLGGGNYNRFHGRSGTLDITRVSPTAIIGEFAIMLAKFDDEVEVTGKFSLPPGSPGSGGLFGRFKDDHPCLMLASPESDTGGSGAGRAPSGNPEPSTDHPPPITPGDDSADNSTGRAPLPDTDPESESNGGSSDTPNGVDLGNVNGENLERAKTKLDFVEGSNAAIRSIAQVVQVRQDGAVASLSSTSFNMTLALPQRELSECGLNQRDPLGFIELLSMTNGERGRMVVYLEGISLQLGVSSGEITLKLGIAGGDITLRGSAPEVESLSPEASGSVLAEVSGASLEGTINQHSFACNNLLDFAFLVTTVH